MRKNSRATLGQIRKGDPPSFRAYARIAEKEGELGTHWIGDRVHLERWGIPESEWKEDKELVYWHLGFLNTTQ